MQVTIDISMYPNREDFVPPIHESVEQNLPDSGTC